MTQNGFKKVIAITSNRSDFSPSYWMHKELHAAFGAGYELWVTGAHLQGSSIHDIKASGLPYRVVDDVTRTRWDDDVDAIVLYGDRHELLPMAYHALVHKIPIVHVCGGDITEGAIDDAIRHALTKLSHIHFPSTAHSAARILQMGEEPWRVHHVGDPALDHFVQASTEEVSSEEFLSELGCVPDKETLLVAVHPETVSDGSQHHVYALSDALMTHPGRLIITGPAPDPGVDIVRERLLRLASEHQHAVYKEHLGHKLYRACLKRVGLLVGNSSSGIIEAGTVPVYAINVGDRQRGRERGGHVIEVASDAHAIRVAIQEVLSKDKESLKQMINPYGTGDSGKHIAKRLRQMSVTRDALLAKKFVDTMK